MQTAHGLLSVNKDINKKTERNRLVYIEKKKHERMKETCLVHWQDFVRASHGRLRLLPTLFISELKPAILESLQNWKLQRVWHGSHMGSSVLSYFRLDAMVWVQRKTAKIITESTPHSPPSIKSKLITKNSFNLIKQRRGEKIHDLWTEKEENLSYYLSSIGEREKKSNGFTAIANQNIILHTKTPYSILDS